MDLPSYSLREKLLKVNNLTTVVEKFKNTNQIKEFDNRLWRKIDNTDVFMFRNFMQIFEEGLNIGTCGLSTKYLSFLFEEFQIVTGKCNILKGTKGAPEGEHVWLESDNYIYDTTLLLKIDKKIGYNLFGYVCENVETSQELAKDESYILQRKLARNKEMVTWKKGLVRKLKERNMKSETLGLY